MEREKRKALGNENRDRGFAESDLSDWSSEYSESDGDGERRGLQGVLSMATRAQDPAHSASYEPEDIEQIDDNTDTEDRSAAEKSTLGDAPTKKSRLAAGLEQLHTSLNDCGDLVPSDDDDPEYHTPTRHDTDSESTKRRKCGQSFLSWSLG